MNKDLLLQSEEEQENDEWFEDMLQAKFDAELDKIDSYEPEFIEERESLQDIIKRKNETIRNRREQRGEDQCSMDQDDTGAEITF